MFDTQEAWDKEVAETQEALDKKKYGPLPEFGSRTIYERILDYPECYAEFGVYWFAVKDVLRRHGYDFGDVDDAEMREAYRGKTDGHTLIAAEEFKKMYRKTYYASTTHFTLEDDGMREWVLNDPDMAARKIIERKQVEREKLLNALRNKRVR